jgi:hypothetical protein
MMGAFQNHRDQKVTVPVEPLVSANHFLRAVEATIDFSFIEEQLQPIIVKITESPYSPCSPF